MRLLLLPIHGLNIASDGEDGSDPHLKRVRIDFPIPNDQPQANEDSATCSKTRDDGCPGRRCVEFKLCPVACIAYYSRENPAMDETHTICQLTIFMKLEAEGGAKRTLDMRRAVDTVTQ